MMMSTSRFPIVCLTALLLVFISVQSISASETSGQNSGFNLTQSDDLLTLEASGASLVAIIDKLQELTEIPISFSEPFDREIELELHDVDVETLIGKLASNNLITKLDYQSYIKISEILLMPDGKEGGNNLASLPSGEPTEAIVVGAEQPAGDQSPSEPPTPTPETSEQTTDEGTGDGNGVKVDNTSTQ